MRVAVLGAGGGVGRRLARDLAEHPEVGHVQIVDETESFAAGLFRADVAVGCMGADADLELKAAELAVEMGIPFISSCESIATYEALSQLEDKAQAKGTLVLAGLGLSPGLSNLLCRAGADLLDEVSSVEISWVASCVGELGSEALLRAMRALSGPAPVFEDGGWHRTPAGTSVETIYFPEPVGWRKVHLCKGSEVLSLPGSMPAVGHVSTRCGVTERGVDRAARRVAEMSFLSGAARRDRLIGMSRPVLPLLSRLSGPRHTWSALRVDVKGIAEGLPRTVTLGVLDQFANLVSVPLAVGAIMIGRGEIKGSGVLAPEQVIVPGDFFARLAERGVRVGRLDI